MYALLSSKIALCFVMRTCKKYEKESRDVIGLLDIKSTSYLLRVILVSISYFSFVRNYMNYKWGHNIITACFDDLGPSKPKKDSYKRLI